MDRERISQFAAVITASDSGVPILHSNATLFLVVLDANDNDPVFEDKSLQMELPENTPPGYMVHHFVASDADDGDNGLIKFHLGGTGLRNAFQLDSATGKSKRIDMEIVHVIRCNNVPCFRVEMYSICDHQHSDFFERLL